MLGLPVHLLVGVCQLPFGVNAWVYPQLAFYSPAAGLLLCRTSGLVAMHLTAIFPPPSHLDGCGPAVVLRRPLHRGVLHCIMVPLIRAQLTVSAVHLLRAMGGTRAQGHFGFAVLVRQKRASTSPPGGAIMEASYASAGPLKRTIHPAADGNATPSGGGGRCYSMSRSSGG